MKTALTLLLCALVFVTSADNGDIRYLADAHVTTDLKTQAELSKQLFWQNFKAANRQWSVVFDERSGLPHRAFQMAMVIHVI